MPAVRILGCGLILLFGVSTGSYAQQEPPSPGEVEETLRRDEPPLDTREIPPIEMPEAPRPEVAPGGRAVPVTTLEIVGNTVLDDAEISAFAAQYEGEVMTLAQVYEAADRLTDLYRANGYGLATAVVPAQRVDSGTVRIEVIEGRVGSIAFEGNERYDADFLAAQFDTITPGSVFRNAELEREALLLNDLPGLTARAVVKPGAEYGTSDIVIRVTEKPFDYRFMLDNYGRDSIGEIRLTADGSINGLTGRGDRLSGTLIQSQSSLLTYGRVAYGMPVGTEGDRMRFTYGHAAYDVGTAVFIPLDIDGTSTTARIDYLRPFERSRSRNIILGAALVRTDSESSSLGATTTDSGITLLEVSGFMSRNWPDRAVSTVSVSLATNFQGNSDGTETDAQLARVRVDGSHTVPFADRWSGVVRGAVALSPDPLVDTQKFSLGGPQMLRGYVSSEARGDQGMSVSLELQRRFRYRDVAAQGYGFLDLGTVRRKSLPADPPNTDHSDTLASVGLGLAVQPAQRWSMNLVLAKPVGGYTPADGDTGVRLWASAAVAF